jgi:hypothetical protein
VQDKMKDQSVNVYSESDPILNYAVIICLAELFVLGAKNAVL